MVSDKYKQFNCCATRQPTTIWMGLLNHMATIASATYVGAIELARLYAVAARDRSLEKNYRRRAAILSGTFSRAAEDAPTDRILPLARLRGGGKFDYMRFPTPSYGVHKMIRLCDVAKRPQISSLEHALAAQEAAVEAYKSELERRETASRHNAGNLSVIKRYEEIAAKSKQELQHNKNVIAVASKELAARKAAMAVALAATIQARETATEAHEYALSKAAEATYEANEEAMEAIIENGAAVDECARTHEAKMIAQALNHENGLIQLRDQEQIVAQQSAEVESKAQKNVDEALAATIQARETTTKAQQEQLEYKTKVRDLGLALQTVQQENEAAKAKAQREYKDKIAEVREIETEACKQEQLEYKTKVRDLGLALQTVQQENEAAKAKAQREYKDKIAEVREIETEACKQEQSKHEATDILAANNIKEVYIIAAAEATEEIRALEAEVVAESATNDTKEKEMATKMEALEDANAATKKALEDANAATMKARDDLAVIKTTTAELQSQEAANQAAIFAIEKKYADAEINHKAKLRSVQEQYAKSEKDQSDKYDTWRLHDTKIREYKDKKLNNRIKIELQELRLTVEAERKVCMSEHQELKKIAAREDIALQTAKKMIVTQDENYTKLEDESNTVAKTLNGNIKALKKENDEVKAKAQKKYEENKAKAQNKVDEANAKALALENTLREVSEARKKAIKDLNDAKAQRATPTVDKRPISLSEQPKQMRKQLTNASADLDLKNVANCDIPDTTEVRVILTPIIDSHPQGGNFLHSRFTGPLSQGVKLTKLTSTEITFKVEPRTGMKGCQLRKVGQRWYIFMNETIVWKSIELLVDQKCWPIKKLVGEPLDQQILELSIEPIEKPLIEIERKRFNVQHSGNEYILYEKAFTYFKGEKFQHSTMVLYFHLSGNRGKWICTLKKANYDLETLYTSRVIHFTEAFKLDFNENPFHPLNIKLIGGATISAIPATVQTINVQVGPLQGSPYRTFTFRKDKHGDFKDGVYSFSKRQTQWCIESGSGQCILKSKAYAELPLSSKVQVWSRGIGQVPLWPKHVTAFLVHIAVL